MKLDEKGINKLIDRIPQGTEDKDVDDYVTNALSVKNYNDKKNEREKNIKNYLLHGDETSLQKLDPKDQLYYRGLEKKIQMTKRNLEQFETIKLKDGTSQIINRSNGKVVNDKTLSLNSNKLYIGMENIESYTGRYIRTENEVEGLANKFKISRYAHNADYHRILGEKLARIVAVLEREFAGHRFAYQVDAGALPEVFWAEKAKMPSVLHELTAQSQKKKNFTQHNRIVLCSSDTCLIEIPPY